MLTNHLCCVMIHTPLCWKRKNISTNENSGATNVSSPLLCICKYFICHPNTKLEAFDVGILHRQSNQRHLAILYLLQLFLPLLVRKNRSKLTEQLCHKVYFSYSCSVFLSFFFILTSVSSKLISSRNKSCSSSTLPSNATEIHLSLLI